MASKDTQFTKENQPKGRGRSFKAKLIETIRQESLLETSPGSSPETVEQAFLSHISKRAFDKDDQASPTLLKELLSKAYSSLKATMPVVQFTFDANGTPAEQVTQLMEAASNGVLPPDVAATFVHAVKAAVDIEAATDLKHRIEQLEEMLNA